MRMSKTDVFMFGVVAGIFVSMLVFTMKINLHPKPKSMVKFKIYVDGNFCRIEALD